VTRLMDSLVRHERLVSAMREASEGLIQTVAEEIEKQRKITAPYTPVAHVKRTPADAMVYNKVV